MSYQPLPFGVSRVLIVKANGKQIQFFFQAEGGL
jgi:hypothetical protein